MQKSELLELKKIVLRAVDISREVILKYYETDFGVEWKADATPVTVADKLTEEKLREFFARETPEFGVLGEEFGMDHPEREWQWIIDPIDGTKSFIHGVPLFGTLIGLWSPNEAVMGLIDLPALNKSMIAAQGLGCEIDGKKVSVSKIDQLDDALLLTGTVNTFETKGYNDSFDSLRKKVRLYRGWGDCYGYFLAASGRADLMIDPVVSMWDIAPLPIIFSEAGGQFTTLNGNLNLPDRAQWSQSDILTGIGSNGHLHKAALSHFKI